MTLQDSATAIGAPAPAQKVTVNGIRLEVVEKGRGRPLLFLHPGIGLDPDAPVIDKLAEHARVLAPSHPGFGNSEQPKSFTTVDDLAYFYLDLLDELDLKEAVLVGVSFGGLIPAESALNCTARLSHRLLAHEDDIQLSDIR